MKHIKNFNESNKSSEILNESEIVNGKAYTKEEVIKLCKSSFQAGTMYCATEGKIYGQSDDFNAWSSKNI